MASHNEKIWPFDEVKISQNADQPEKFHISAPWLEHEFKVVSEQLDKASQIVQKFSQNQIQTAEDLEDISWFMHAVQKYPLYYILPRGEDFGVDQHDVQEDDVNAATPRDLLKSLIQDENVAASLQRLLQALPEAWSWDGDAAVDFSQGPYGIDPQSVFSVARRFHLLNDVENNQTPELLAYVQKLGKQTQKFYQATHLIVRQNHYITQQCESVLRAALPAAQASGESILEFITEESGHDRILEKALLSLGEPAEASPVLDSTVIVMELFRKIGRRNLLGFAMVVDIFERTSYHQQDPISQTFNDGGATDVAQHMAHHRQINDMGGHENVALEFLEPMKAVSAAYAIESLKLAELLTLVIHMVSKETLEVLKARAG